MSEIVARLGNYFSEKNLKTYKVEQEIGVSNGSIGSAIRENRAVGTNVIEKIIAKYPIDPVWLLTGKGAMDKNNLENNAAIQTTPPPGDDFVSVQTELISTQRQLLCAQTEEIKEMKSVLALQKQANYFIGQRLQMLMGDVSLLRNPNAQVFENLAIKKEMQRLGLITADIAQK
jgi:hypothetical protein